MELILEAKVIETKNHYTIDTNLKEIWGIQKPVMKKILYGVEIQKPTAYRIYKHDHGCYRVWVFGDLEINPDRFTVKKIEK